MNKRIFLFVIGLIATGLLSFLWPRIERPPSRFEIARQLLEQGRAEEALLLFADPMWRGVAEYRAGRYTRAVGEFYLEQNTVALYNMGTAYAQLEEWAGAIAALEQVLRLQPDHADARHNLELVLQAAELDDANAVRADKEPQLKQGEGNRRQQQSTEDGNPTQRRPRDGSDSDTASAEALIDQAGNSDTPGELGDNEKTDQMGTAVAYGNLDSNIEDTTPDMGGSKQLKARESAQAAEILLREIRDDPEKVLRVRLFTAHRARQTEATQ